MYSDFRGWAFIEAKCWASTSCPSKFPLLFHSSQEPPLLERDGTKFVANLDRKVRAREEGEGNRNRESSAPKESNWPTYRAAWSLNLKHIRLLNEPEGIYA